MNTDTDGRMKCGKKYSPLCNANVVVRISPMIYIQSNKWGRYITKWKCEIGPDLVWTSIWRYVENLH